MLRKYALLIYFFIDLQSLLLFRNKHVQKNSQWSIVSSTQKYVDNTNFRHKKDLHRQIASPFKSQRKETLRGQLNLYKNGEIDASVFKQRLIQNQIQINTQLDALIRKTEAGDHKNYTQFGAEIFKQVDLQEKDSSLFKMD